jgi:hypothetical protein
MRTKLSCPHFGSGRWPDHVPHRIGCAKIKPAPSIICFSAPEVHPRCLHSNQARKGEKKVRTGFKRYCGLRPIFLDAQ